MNTYNGLLVYHMELNSNAVDFICKSNVAYNKRAYSCSSIVVKVWLLHVKFFPSKSTRVLDKLLNHSLSCRL